MYIDELVIEITRRCNTICEHCMRGNAQAKDIDNLTIDNALVGVDSIGTITFSGGEPSLAVDRIRYFTEAVKKAGISVGSFFVITNGKVASIELLHALLDLYAYCDEPSMSHLIISQDQFHTGYSNRTAMDLYKGVRFFNAEEYARDFTIVVGEGLAIDNGLGNRSPNMESLVIDYDDDGGVYGVEGTVYVNALGDVLPSCEFSYETQEEEKIGNVHENTILEIITRYAEGLVEVDLDLVVNHNDEMMEVA